jgi:hypothetical protein
MGDAALTGDPFFEGLYPEHSGCSRGWEGKDITMSNLVRNLLHRALQIVGCGLQMHYCAGTAQHFRSPPRHPPRLTVHLSFPL